MTGKQDRWPPLAFTALGVPAPPDADWRPDSRPAARRWRCRWCGDEFNRGWAAVERHSTVCEERPSLHAGWIELVV